MAESIETKLNFGGLIVYNLGLKIVIYLVIKPIGLPKKTG